LNFSGLWRIERGRVPGLSDGDLVELGTSPRREIGTGHEEQLGPAESIAEFASFADQRLALRMTAATTTHFEAAVNAYAAYAEPSDAPN